MPRHPVNSPIACMTLIGFFPLGHDNDLKEMDPRGSIGNLTAPGPYSTHKLLKTDVPSLHVHKYRIIWDSVDSVSLFDFHP